MNRRNPATTPRNELIRQFEDEFGSRDCHVLLGCNLGTRDGQAKFRNEQLAQRCIEYTGRAAEIAATILIGEEGVFEEFG